MKNNTLSDEDKTMFLLIAPSLMGFMLFFLLPFVLSFYLSLVDSNMSMRYVGMYNYKAVLENEGFRLAIKNTLLFLSMYLPISIILPLVMALLINKVEKFKDLYIFVFLLPLIIPSGSMVTFWNSVVGINGIINKIFFATGPIDWMNSDYARLFIVIIFVWKNAGYNMVFFLTGLGFIPKEYYEFAKVEGAGALNVLSRITLPSLIPSFFMVIIMSVINSFNAFKEIRLLAGDYPHLSIYMLQHYINNQLNTFNYQKLASSSYIISVLFVVVALGILRYQNKTLGRV